MSEWHKERLAALANDARRTDDDSRMPPFLAAMRPHQWVKNLLVLAPLFFTKLVFSATAWLEVGLAFASFCLAASSIYLLNDIIDRHEDALHPKKRLRPIASGALPVGVARVQLVATVGLAAAIALAVPAHDGQSPFWWWPAAYLTLNLLYSFWLKKLVVVDCMCIALGFQLRVQAGAAAIGVAASHWLILCTFFFALFLAFCKRYEEVAKQGEAAGRTRATMDDYSAAFLNMMIGPLAALSILSYALYTVSEETYRRHGTYALMYTIPIVTYGVFRYLFLVYRKSEGGDPSRLLFRDAPLLISGIFYAAVVLLVLQGANVAK